MSLLDGNNLFVADCSLVDQGDRLNFHINHAFAIAGRVCEGSISLYIGSSRTREFTVIDEAHGYILLNYSLPNELAVIDLSCSFAYDIPIEKNISKIFNVAS